MNRTTLAHIGFLAALLLGMYTNAHAHTHAHLHVVHNAQRQAVHSDYTCTHNAYRSVDCGGR